MGRPRVTVLSGGLGGARLAVALQEAGRTPDACFVTNVADDVELDGLLVCPDTDAVLYALAGIFDDERGWGVRGDVFERSGWFNIGHRDRGQHLRRRELLDRGATLTDATSVLAADLGVRARVVPATDDTVRTHVRTHDRWLSFQEWLVRERAQPPVVDVAYNGIETARPSPAVVEAIEAADVVVLAPSSPVASILPILELPGVREALAGRGEPTAAIAPVVRRRPPRIERDRSRARARAALLGSRGIGHDPVAIASLYADVADTYVVDVADAEDAVAVEELGLRPLVAPTVAETASDRAALVTVLLEHVAEAASDRVEG